MPKPGQSGFKRFFYNQNIKRVKSSAKYKNLIEHTIMLAKRLEKEGMTKWIANALNRAQIKIKSYGITFAQVVSSLEHKGLSQFADVVANNLVFVQKKGHNTSSSTKRDVIQKTSTIILGDSESKPKATPKKAPAKKEVVKKEVTTTKAAPKKTPAKTTATSTTKKPTTTKSAPKKAPAKKDA